tara:strand:- start:756 stop:905 length:150 start_codon:yes stop_codon:yes gene_type:complete
VSKSNPPLSKNNNKNNKIDNAIEACTTLESELKKLPIIRLIYILNNVVF